MKNYNPKDRNSVVKYAKKLEGNTLKSLCDNISNDNKKNKGSFGHLLEKFYFNYEPNNNPEPDFPEAGLELKSSPIKELKSGKKSSKERLVLGMIDYMSITNENFECSSFIKKNMSLLLVFYMYQKYKSPIDYIIKVVSDWDIPEMDLKIIKSDWIKIKNKIADGRAHELSEGDTLYLGACTKGSTSIKSLRKQPENSIMAKSRAFSFKQGYVNHILYSLTKNKVEKYGSVFSAKSLAEEIDFEKYIINRFSNFYGMTVEEIQSKLNIDLNRSSKAYYASLTKAILGIDKSKEIEEFHKAGIITKTVRIQDNLRPKEDISFPCFKYEEIVKESWDNSIFKDIVESKFFFVFLKISDDKVKLDKVKFWNMQSNDRLEAKKVWKKTKEIISNGNIVKSIINGRRKTNFPSKRTSEVCHVRPHARNSRDTYKLPVKDEVSQLNEYTKHCFWLNSKYVSLEVLPD